MNEESIESRDCVCEAKDIVKVFELVNKLHKKYEKLHRNNIQKLELTPTQHYIFRKLWEKDGRQFKNLAEGCNCSRSTITGVVDTMEKKGLVFREANLKDRRSMLVKLTENGKKLKSSTPPLETMVSGCCEGIKQEEIESLGVLLEKLLNSLIV